MGKGWMVEWKCLKCNYVLISKSNNTLDVINDIVITAVTVNNRF